MATTEQSWFLFGLVLALLFSENTGKLHIEEMRVPNPFIFGSAAELGCAYSWEGHGSGHRHLYSVKWFKDNEEFYRYVPSEDPKIVIFPKPGVSVDVGRSGAERVYLTGVNWATEGAFRCEVTADDFETVSDSRESNVVAVPRSGPSVIGAAPRYSVGDSVSLNCSSNSSDPLADLSWYINSESALPRHLVAYPWVREPTNLMTTVLGLNFRLAPHHVRYDSTVKVKCTAMLQTVYLKSNEITLEVEKQDRRRGSSKTSSSSSTAKRDRLTSSSSSSGNSVVPALESRDGDGVATWEHNKKRSSADQVSSSSSSSGKRHSIFSSSAAPATTMPNFTFLLLLLYPFLATFRG